jgi:dimeric dUTPase (all-alpha-NTP-PPase superfamily)
MEDSRLLSLIDKVSTTEDSDFHQTCQELLGLFKKYLNKTKKLGLGSNEQNQLRTYLAKRLLNGSTSDESHVQDR